MQHAVTTTTMFCISSGDGSIAPAWSEQDDVDLAGTFEAGLTVADRYLLRERLGGGAMGRVFLAQDLRLERPVAIKVVAHAADPDLRLDDLLEREAKLGASLNHKGITAVLDFGFHGNKSYTVFEFVEGETLRTLMDRRGNMPLSETQQVVSDLAIALDFAHAKGIVHRDLKPENICLTKSGEFKILDLGVARKVRQEQETGVYSGTPAYSSPEQADCRHTDGRSDQYSLALIAFEMLTGRKPFWNEDALQLLRLHTSVPAPDPRSLQPDLPGESAAAIQRALQKHPEERFPTCQEFAYALGQAGTIHARHTMRTTAEERIAFYLCHGGEESLVARRIAEGLEQRGFRCWYYGRDTIPGVSSLGQSKEAMEQSRSVILLVSRSVIRSRVLRPEIEYAHALGCPMLPVLVDLTREEFEKLNPPWRAMLGVNPIIEQRRLDHLGELLARFQSAASALSITPESMPSDRNAVHDERISGQRWATDANQIDITDLDRVVYQNDIISDFLDRPHKYFLAGTKGLGKTLLLTRKRQLLTQTTRGGERSLTLIPEGRPYLDFMSEMRSLSWKFEQPLSELSTTKRLWSAAFRISAISHHPSVVLEEELEELSQFPDRIRRWMRGTKIEPTVVFKELTSLQVSRLNRLIDDSENLLDQQLRRIHGSIHIFIDKVDQAIRHLSREAWICIQAGMIEAAWEIMNANSHVKIFATIRQEAFANYQSDIKSNLFGATTSLEYTSEELGGLLDRLSSCYEGCQSFADFIGMNVVRHPRRAVPEDSFHYVRRHTLGRPRDLVAIASELSRSRSSLSERRLRQIVERASATAIVSNILDEMQVFLDCLHDRQTRIRFLSLIPANVLEKSTAIEICEDFNGLERGTLRHFGENSPEIHHPFHDLYVAGLLGAIGEDAESGTRLQRFRQPSDSVSDIEIPNSEFYFIHPALNDAIAQARGRKPYVRIQQIPAGDGLPWRPEYSHVTQIERLLQNDDTASFRDGVHAVLAEILSIIESGDTRFVRAKAESSEAWRSLQQCADVDACGEVLLWLDELLESL